MGGASANTTFFFNLQMQIYLFFAIKLEFCFENSKYWMFNALNIESKKQDRIKNKLMLI